MSRRHTLLIAGPLLLVLVAASPFALRELGPTTYVYVRSTPEARAVKVWYVLRDRAFWIRCGDYERQWCRDLLQHPSSKLGTPDAWRTVQVKAMRGDAHAARFQQWLEEDHPMLGWLPRLTGMDRPLVFRLAPRG